MTSDIEDDVAALRAFNRYYTRRVGILEPYLGGTLTLTEVRVLYELAHSDGITATEISKKLDIDTGYLSRLLKRFEASEWIRREASTKDGRQTLVTLLPTGHEAYAPLHAKSQAHATGVLSSLSPYQRTKLLDALTTIEHALDAPPPSVVIRGLEAGDLGWITQAHGEFYSKKYNWGLGFESLVGGVLADFGKTYRPGEDRLWMATLDGERVGCVMLVKVSDEVAKLRMLLVQPSAQGLGLGKRLLTECIAFAKQQGHKRLELLTQSDLTVARAMYAKAGFVRESSETHTTFGPRTEAEIWGLVL
jgi:DNA-binding MarR family transcriptional regulator/GNAT superfamily N-acetyltransferase